MVCYEKLSKIIFSKGVKNLLTVSGPVIDYPKATEAVPSWPGHGTPD